MASFTYQKDETLIPIPEPKPERGQRWKTGQTALLRSLSPGQSVFIPGANTWAAEYKNIYVLAKKANIKITARTQDGGLRVWRLE